MRSGARLALRSQVAGWSLCEDLAGVGLRNSESKEPAHARSARKVLVDDEDRSITTPWALPSEQPPGRCCTREGEVFYYIWMIHLSGVAGSLGSALLAC